MVAEAATDSHVVHGAIHDSRGVRRSDPVADVVVGVCVGLFATWLVYAAIAMILNCTTIELGPVHLTAKSGPLPILSLQRVNTRLRSGDIARFEVRPSARRGDDATFKVLAVHFDGRPSVLLRAMTAEHALYIASELDDALRRDDPIA